LLGARPNGPEVEYGWIEVGAAVHGELFEVHGFHEKPPLHVAEHLFKSGGLWNTFVMVGHVDAFLRMSWAAAPGLVEVFQPTVSGSRCKSETRIPESLYDWVSPMDFSRQVLSLGARHLVTLRLGDMEWHDLGDPDRVVSTLLARNEELPPWASRWQAARRGVAGSAPLSNSAVA
jgi:mannose-1-phosphate guanylyltransferase